MYIPLSLSLFTTCKFKNRCNSLLPVCVRKNCFVRSWWTNKTSNYLSFKQAPKSRDSQVFTDFRLHINFVLLNHGPKPTLHNSSKAWLTINATRDEGSETHIVSYAVNWNPILESTNQITNSRIQ